MSDENRPPEKHDRPSAVPPTLVEVVGTSIEDVAAAMNHLLGYSDQDHLSEEETERRAARIRIFGADPEEAPRGSE